LYNGAFVCKTAVPHFVDNGDGTVTDNVTGLMWEQKTGVAGAVWAIGMNDGFVDEVGKTFRGYARAVRTTHQ
jgi:hypothetical protein